MDKIDRYQWGKMEAKTRNANVAPESLNIDTAYQRGRMSEKIILGICRGMDMDKFGTLVVGERENGDMYVVDGQQRLSAWKRRGEKKSVPCRIFVSKGQAHEAAVFKAINENRTRVRAIDAYRSAVCAGLSPEIDIDKELRKMGMRMVKKNGSSDDIDFPHTFIRAWNINSKQALDGLRIGKIIVSPDAMHNITFKGIVFLLKKGIDVMDHADKIIRMGGQPKIIQMARATAIELGHQNVNDGTCGIGLLRLINHRKRIRIRLESDDK